MTDEQCVAIMAAIIYASGSEAASRFSADKACGIFAAVQLERKRRFIAPMGHDLSEEDGNAQ